MTTPGTQNGDGMHLLVITPEMVHRYSRVRNWCPNAQRTTSADYELDEL